MLKILTIAFISLVMLTAGAVSAFAQSLGGGSAIGVTLAEQGVKDGDIITLTPNGYVRSKTPYDPSVVGVVSSNPSVYLQDEGRPSDIPVVTNGKVAVKVSTINGPIKRGDLITTSTIPGVGQKATDNGMIIGSADEDYTEKDPKKIDTIYVILSPQFAQLNNNITNLSNVFRAGLSSVFQTPLGALRYIVAGFIALISFFFGFRFFAHTSRSGVEAIGRNPLASKAILFSVGINTMITIVIMLLGVALGYLILVL